jgi:hypothetical protein
MREPDLNMRVEPAHDHDGRKVLLEPAGDQSFVADRTIRKFKCPTCGEIATVEVEPRVILLGPVENEKAARAAWRRKNLGLKQ